MRWILVLFLLCCSTAVASDYTFNNGFYWQGDRAFTRKQVKYKRFTHEDRHCRYYVWDTRWEYTFSHERPKPVQAPVVVTPDKEPDRAVAGTERWRSELIALAASKHKWSHQLQESAQEQQEFLEAVDALGLKNYAQVNQIYQQVNPGAYSLTGKFQATQGPFAQQGSTLYGYNAFAPKYSDVDLQTLFNQANQLAQNSQQLAGKATGDFSSLVSQQAEISSEIDRINARGQQTGQLLNIISELLRDRAVQQTAEVTVTPVAPQQPGTAPPGTATKLSETEQQRLLTVLESRCVSCHNPDDKGGGWDLTQYTSYSPRQKYDVVQSLQGKGPKGKQMPLNEPPLPTDEMMLIVRDYLSTQ